jgi:hypothetical protein
MRKIAIRAESLIKLWQKNFINDTNKFIKATYLQPTDLHREFEDEKGVKWRILGVIEGKDLACERVDTLEIFALDRWKVSMILHPEDHARGSKTIETIYPSSKKAKAPKAAPVPKEEPRSPQLDLFNSEES